MQINICGLAHRTSLCLDQYINTQNADLVFLSETKSQSHSIVTNFYCHLKPNMQSPSRAGGVAILVNNKHVSDRMQVLEYNDVDAMFVVVTLFGTRLLLCSVYIPPNSSDTLQRFFDIISRANLELKSLKCQGLVIIGDLNARHSDWGNQVDNIAGQKLAAYTMKENFSVVNMFSGNTFLCENGGSRIDLAIVSNSLHSLFVEQHTDSTIELFTGAPRRGHIPIWTTLEINGGPLKSRVITAWSEADWLSFGDSLETTLSNISPQLLTSHNPITIWNRLKCAMLDTKAKTVPSKQVSNFSKPYWNSELSQMSKEVRNARKAFKYRSDFRNGELLEKAKDAFSLSLAEAKNAYIAKRTDQLNGAGKDKFWQHFKDTFYKKSHTNKTIGVLIDPDENYVLEDCNKATLLYNDIFQGNHLKSAKFDEEWKQQVEKFLTQEQASHLNPESLNSRILIDEILVSMKNLKCNGKGPDNDGIHPLMIKHGGEQLLMLLLHLFNVVFTSQIWPWKSGKVIFLRKEGKPSYNVTSAFRPITITSYVAKLLERVLECRLRKYVEDKGVLPTAQHGFRKGRSTGTYICNMIRALQHNRNTKQLTAGLFIDLQKAFDSVWVNGLLYRLANLGIVGKFLTVITSFLKPRYVQIKVNDYTSGPLPCHVGVPQGSVLSPLLFAIYIHDMLDNTSGLQLQYADDCSILVSAESEQELSRLCQTNCNLLDLWLCKWHMMANSSKSHLIPFYNNSTILAPTLSGKDIITSAKTSVLGICVDAELKFIKQKQKAKHIISTKWNLLQPFVNHGLKPSVLKRILLTTVIPAALYLSHLWDCSDSLSIYTQLKHMLHAPFFPPGEFLHSFVRILPIPLLHIKMRLTSLRQLIIIDPGLLAYPKSKLTLILRSELAKLLNIRILTSEINLSVIDIKQSAINRHINNLWAKRWAGYNLRNSGYGLFSMLDDKQQIIDKNPIPLERDARLLGSLCALLTGHSRLQAHQYLLKLTLAPTCSCLGGDETPYHFIFECELYQTIRKNHMPSLNDWNSILNYINISQRKP